MSRGQVRSSVRAGQSDAGCNLQLHTQYCNKRYTLVIASIDVLGRVFKYKTVLSIDRSIPKIVQEFNLFVPLLAWAGTARHGPARWLFEVYF